MHQKHPPAKVASSYVFSVIDAILRNKYFCIVSYIRNFLANEMFDFICIVGRGIYPIDGNYITSDYEEKK
ncbi:hypothetical protein GCM10007140_12610 [Priestia taiwanensis]|uniref:Uncharacterized protein n=1 Tax=Priestia taiwanensis TaxID=1347902 RepID=A0A917AQZ9_9BACI|nr:hypothetical protein GCM10007140_12610 [Priestia taiwanensis]